MPHVILVGNYCFIPLRTRFGLSYSDKVLEPYRLFTKDMRKVLKELSFKGRCAYIETNYHGGSGQQMAETWDNGLKILGPLVTLNDILKPEIYKEAQVVENAINENLAALGIYRHEGKDEFGSARLDEYRSNHDVIQEYENPSSGTSKP